MSRLPYLVEKLVAAGMRMKLDLEAIQQENGEKDSVIAEMQLEIEALEADNLRLGKEVQNLQGISIPPCFAIKAFEQSLKSMKKRGA